MPGRILIGDNRKTLATLPAGSVHAVVTSPPYYSLRQYLPKDHPDKHLELGSELTPDEYLANQVAVFREVKRVLRDDGLCFVNLGDTISSGTASKRNPSKNLGGDGYGKHGYWTNPAISQRVNDPALKDGDQMLMPHRFALAMVADGWWLRDTIVWHKPSTMPSSQNGWRWERCRVKVKDGVYNGRRDPNRTDCEFASNLHHQEAATFSDCPGCDKCRDRDGWILRNGRFRTTTAHEYVFLFAKSKSYFGDAEQCKEPVTGNTHGQNKRSHPKETANAADGNGHADWRKYVSDKVESRLPRSVWRITAEPYKKSHFATFPTQLVRKCLSLAVNPKGCCPTCGSQYAPVVQKERVPTRPARESNTYGHDAAEFGNRDPERHVQKTNVLDYWPTCGCKAGPPQPCVVLDPYGGSGTTAQAAQALGHDWIICELNAAYVDQERIDTLPKWARRNGTAKAANGDRAMPLFANLEGT